MKLEEAIVFKFNVIGDLLELYAGLRVTSMRQTFCPREKNYGLDAQTRIKAEILLKNDAIQIIKRGLVQMLQQEDDVMVIAKPAGILAEEIAQMFNGDEPEWQRRASIKRKLEEEAKTTSWMRWMP